MVGGLTLFFGIWLSSCSSTICWKGYSTPIELSWQPCSKPIEHKCQGLFYVFWLSVLFHSSLYLCLCQVSRYLNYCSFVTGFEIKKFRPTNWVLLFKDCLALLSSLHFHIHFRVHMSISAKKKSSLDFS